MRTVGLGFALCFVLTTGVHATPLGCSPSEIAEYVSDAKRAEVALDFRSKMASYAQASACGDAASMYQLAWMYFGANDIPGRHFQDYLKAAYWFQKAADLNYTPALTQLGIMYGADGSLGVPADQVKATQLLLRASQMGDAQAMNNLGVRYMRGLGTAKDLDQAIYWWRRAAAAGGTSGKAAQSWLNMFDREQSASQNSG